MILYSDLACLVTCESLCFNWISLPRINPVMKRVIAEITRNKRIVMYVDTILPNALAYPQLYGSSLPGLKVPNDVTKCYSSYGKHDR